MKRWLTDQIFIDIHNERGEEPEGVPAAWYTGVDALHALRLFVEQFADTLNRWNEV